MTSVDTHPYATKVLKHMAEHLAQQELLGQLTQMDTRRPLIRNEGAARTLLNSELQRATPRFPVLVVLSPVPAPPPLWNIPWPAFLRRNAAEFEVVGVLPMHATDVSAEDVIQFLHRIVFSPNRRPLAPPKRSKGDDIINSNLADVAVEPGV